MAKLLQNKMRKVFAFAAVAGLLTFAACGEKKAESTESATETMVDSAAPMEAMVDSAAATMDSAAATMDTAAEAAHGAAEKVEEHAEKM